MGTTGIRSEHAQDTGDLTPFRAYLIGSAVWYLVMVALPTSLQGPWYVVLAVVSLAICTPRAWRLPQAVRRPVTFLVLAGWTSLTAALLRAVSAAVTGVDNPFPSPAEPFVFASYILFLAAIWDIIRKRTRKVTLDPVLDATVGTIAVALLVVSLALIPYVQSSGASNVAIGLNVAYSGFSLLLVAFAILALVTGSEPTTSNRLLAAGLVASFVLDTTAVLVISERVPVSIQNLMLGFPLVFGAAGILHPSVVRLTARPTGDDLRRRLSRRRISVLALALLTPPALMLWAVVDFDVESWLMLPALASLALTPLVVTRLGRLVRQNEEMATLEATLRGVGERLVSADSPDDVVRVVTVGAEQVLGTNFISGGLVHHPFNHDSLQTSGPLRPALVALEQLLTDGRRTTTGELTSLEIGDGTVWLVGLVVVQRELRGAIVLSTHKQLSDDEQNAVTALCRESAIALRAVDHTEQQVRQRSEDRFGALIDNSSDIVAVLRNDMGLSYVSPVAQRLLGYPAQQLASVDVMGLIHRDDREAATKMLSDIRFGLRETVEIRLRHFAGTYAWFEVVGVDLSSDPNIAGVVLNAREIGDRKMAEERLAFSEARFKALVQNSTDLVVVIDSRGGISYASPSVEGVLGQLPEEIQGCSLDEIFRDNDLSWASYQNGQTLPGDDGLELVEFRFRNASGDWHTIETTVTDLRDEPAVAGFVLNARDVTYRKNMEQRLRYQATHDELTGLANRVHVLEDLAGMLGRNSGSTTVAAILIDIDDFKDINDSLGHAFGDQLLTAVAERITGMLSFGDVAARIGGDEFVIVLERAHGESHITDLSDQILSAIASPFVIDSRELTITASAGIVFDHDRQSSGEILLRNADTAMYRAKTLGKRQTAVFETYMHTASFDRLELRADLARAVAHEQFVAHYQPVVDIETRQIVGAEALIRWEHPRRGLLGPVLFIPLAEETGLIGPLGEWILERACTDLAQWREDYGEMMMDFTMSVNLSVQQLHDERIVATVNDILQRAGLPAQRLVLEVTESTLITETDKVRSTMHELRSLGSRLAVDDFGTGYSSLGYIQQFEFDVLKIDKTFVDDLDRFTNQRIVTAVLDLANQLGVKTIAEGIEQELQAELLKTLGCKLGQGYLYSRPVPEAEFRELLMRDRSSVTGHPVL